MKIVLRIVTQLWREVENFDLIIKWFRGHWPEKEMHWLNSAKPQKIMILLLRSSRKPWQNTETLIHWKDSMKQNEQRKNLSSRNILTPLWLMKSVKKVPYTTYSVFWCWIKFCTLCSWFKFLSKFLGKKSNYLLNWSYVELETWNSSFFLLQFFPFIYLFFWCVYETYIDYIVNEPWMM